MREPPRPNYDYEIRQLVRVFEQALRDIQAELNSLFLTDFERAQIVAVEENIRQILRDLREYSDDWSRKSITEASREGIASTIYALGLADTFEEALKIARFSGINRELVRAIIADTQADLLAITQNVDRKTRSAIRQATADVMRAKAATGISQTQSLQNAITREIRNRLGQAADSAIVDAAGRRWKLRAYTEMLARTKMMEAHIEASINEAINQDAEFGVVSRHYGTCPKCSPWEGRIIALNPNNTQGYPTIDEARAGGLWHPNCKHTLTPVRRLDRLPADLRELNEV